MKIISAARYKGSTVCVETDNAGCVYVDEKIVNEYNIKSGMTIPDAAFDEILVANLRRKAKERALYLLSERDYSFVSLYKKLSVSYPGSLCLEICKGMAELGLINDLEYGRKKARELFEVKRYGMYRVKQELKQKGLTEEVIAEVTEPYNDGTLERLEELIERKYLRRLESENGIKTVGSALVRMGYSFDSVNTVLNKYR